MSAVSIPTPTIRARRRIMACAPLHRSTVVRHRVAVMRSCGHRHLLELDGTDLGRGPVAVPLNDPALVVGPPELLEREPQLLDGLEAPHPEQVLFQRPDEPLGA